MKIVDSFKKILNKFKNRNKNSLLLELPENLYEDLIKSPKIDNMINNMPKNLSQIEKAYYIYLELGKNLNENPYFVLTDRKGKEEHYNDKIEENEYYGICKSISELYASILKDERIGIKTELIKKTPESAISHVDTILKIDGKTYIANLTSDLSRIKTSRRVNSFCMNLRARGNFRKEVIEDREAYLKRLEEHYGKIDFLSREEIERLDKKMGYSFYAPQVTKKEERGIYTEDVIELLRKDMDNPDTFKEFVLHGKDVPKEEYLRYKLDYIFKNIDKLTDYNDNIEYLESIRYYLYIARKILLPEEGRRIEAYVATIDGDMSNLISILKVKPSTNENNIKNRNLYYLYSNEEKKYKNKTPEEMKKFIEGLDSKSLNIIGTFDNYKPRKIEELEL